MRAVRLKQDRTSTSLQHFILYLGNDPKISGAAIRRSFDEVTRFELQGRKGIVRAVLLQANANAKTSGILPAIIPAGAGTPTSKMIEIANAIRATNSRKDGFQTCSNYSITSSARPRSVRGTAMPSAFATRLEPTVGTPRSAASAASCPLRPAKTDVPALILAGVSKGHQSTDKRDLKHQDQADSERFDKEMKMPRERFMREGGEARFIEAFCVE